MGTSGKWNSGLAVVALFATPFVACSAYVKVNPDGVPSGGQATYEGLVVVEKRGWQLATIRSTEALALNDAQRSEGKHTETAICLLGGQEQPKLTRVIHQATPDRLGLRLAWVKMIGEPRYTTSICSNSRSTRRNRQAWGSHVRVVRIERAQPIPCSYLTFVRNTRRCLQANTPLKRPAG